MIDINSKVVCINDDWFGWPDMPLDLLNYVKHLPVLNGVYTVRDIYKAERDGAVYLRFAELPNPQPPDDYAEVAFELDHFRPLTSKPTSIEVFQKMLKPAEELV